MHAVITTSTEQSVQYCGVLYNNLLPNSETTRPSVQASIVSQARRRNKQKEWFFSIVYQTHGHLDANSISRGPGRNLRSSLYVYHSRADNTLQIVIIPISSNRPSTGLNLGNAGNYEALAESTSTVERRSLYDKRMVHTVLPGCFLLTGSVSNVAIVSQHTTVQC